MTPTAIATVWEPRLADRSLPTGLPLGVHDETPISGASAQTLVLHDPKGLVLDDPWIPQPQPKLFGAFVLGGPTKSGRQYRLQLVPSGITFAEVEPVAEPDPGTIHDLIAGLSARLKRPLDPILEVLDYPRRTYFTHKKEGTLPGSAALPEKVLALNSLADEDEAAARVLVDTKRDEIRRLLSEGNVTEARHRLHQAKDAMSPTDEMSHPKAIVLEHLDELERLVAEPGFVVAAQAVEWFAERGALAGARVIAMVQLERALRAARAGSDLAPEWDFLPLLRFVAMDAFRARAQAYVDSDVFTGEGWTGFLQTEAERVWTAYQPVVLPPDPVEPAPAEGGSWRYERPTITERMSR